LNGWKVGRLEDLQGFPQDFLFVGLLEGELQLACPSIQSSNLPDIQSLKNDQHSARSIL
jgi:hypothetical protein